MVGQLLIRSWHGSFWSARYSSPWSWSSRSSSSRRNISQDSNDQSSTNLSSQTVWYILMSTSIHQRPQALYGGSSFVLQQVAHSKSILFPLGKSRSVGLRAIGSGKDYLYAIPNSPTPKKNSVLPCNLLTPSPWAVSREKVLKCPESLSYQKKPRAPILLLIWHRLFRFFFFVFLFFF